MPEGGVFFFSQMITHPKSQDNSRWRFGRGGGGRRGGFFKKLYSGRRVRLRWLLPVCVCIVNFMWRLALVYYPSCPGLM
jgi:hypothetical protein